MVIDRYSKIKETYEQIISDFEDCPDKFKMDVIGNRLNRLVYGNYIYRWKVIHEDNCYKCSLWYTPECRDIPHCTVTIEEDNKVG